MIHTINNSKNINISFKLEWYTVYIYPKYIYPRYSLTPQTL